MKKSLLLYNVKAGRGKIARNVDALTEIFRQAGYDIRPKLIEFGQNPSTATRIAILPSYAEATAL